MLDINNISVRGSGPRVAPTPALFLTSLIGRSSNNLNNLYFNMSLEQTNMQLERTLLFNRSAEA